MKQKKRKHIGSLWESFCVLWLYLVEVMNAMKNSFRIIGDVVEIDIKYKGKSYVALASLADWDKIQITGTWHGMITGGSTVMYVRGKNKGKDILMHRMLMGYPKGIVDHKNRNSIDNTRGNLRVVTQVENVRNASKRPSKYKVKGVRDAPKGKYNAWIQINKKKKSLGNYNTLLEACRARIQAEVLHYNSVEVQRFPIVLNAPN